MRRYGNMEDVYKPWLELNCRLQAASTTFPLAFSLVRGCLILELCGTASGGIPKLGAASSSFLVLTLQTQ